MTACSPGSHHFEEVLVSGDAVARWCIRCGAVVVDRDTDRGPEHAGHGTIPGGVSPLRIPSLLSSAGRPAGPQGE